MAELLHYIVSSQPWSEYADGCSELGVLPGANRGYVLAYAEGAVALLFHTTTQANAEAILSEGFRPSAALEVGGHPSLGVPGRMMPAGIWASLRPTLPTDQDIWMPDVCGKPWAILKLEVELAPLGDRHVYEHTWMVPQFCLQADDIHKVELLDPDELPRYLHPEVVQRFSEWKADYHVPSLYQDALDRAAAKQEVSK